MNKKKPPSKPIGDDITTIQTTNNTATQPTAIDQNTTNLHHHRIIRMLFMLLGSIFLGLGIVGIVLPVLPTTPFVLLAAACWARGSQRFHDWLISHKIFGPIVRDWQDHRAVPRKAKYLAWSMMTLSCVMLFYRLQGDLIWLAWLTAVVCLMTALWMARLPDA